MIVYPGQSTPISSDNKAGNAMKILAILAGKMELDEVPGQVAW